MPDQYTYLEQVKSVSPGQAGFSMQGGRATLQLFADDDNLLDRIREILGGTEAGMNINGNQAGPYGLHRALPKAHPKFPWLFAERISNIVGYGNPEKTESDLSTNAEVPPFQDYAEYPWYLLTVEFTPRPYVLCQDNKISQYSFNWYKADGNPAISGTPYNAPTQVPSVYADEWMRYTDVEITPASEWITANRGQFLFDVSDGSPPSQVEAGNGQIRMLYQKRVVTFRWYQVPYSHITHQRSNIAAGLGYVNQRDFTGPDGSFFAAGTLLFFAVKVNRYVPPVPDVFTQPSTTIFANNKLCDIEFAMMQVDQPLKAPV